MNFYIDSKNSMNPNSTKNIYINFIAEKHMMISLSINPQGINYTTSILYGEISTESDAVLGTAGLIARDGVNIFVRNSDFHVLPFSILLKK